jgi:hypothetical protein
MNFYDDFARRLAEYRCYRRNATDKARIILAWINS